MELSDFRVIGRGGASTVYAAHEESRGLVAVKVLRPTKIVAEAWTRFEHDRPTLDRLATRVAIVAVHRRAISADGRHYLVTSFMEGGSLADLSADRGPLRQGQVVGLGETLAGTLAAAHGVGVLHGNVKPSNLLVSRGGAVMIADFGVAHLLSATSRARTTPRHVSPDHTAPEVLEGGAPSESADVYALASTLYELVQGRSPFRSRSREAAATIVERKRSAHAPDPTSVDDPTLRRALMAALDPDPAGRPTATELQALLGECDLELLFDERHPVPSLLLGPVVTDPLTGPAGVAASPAPASDTAGEDDGADPGAGADGTTEPLVARLPLPTRAPTTSPAAAPSVRRPVGAAPAPDSHRRVAMWIGAAAAVAALGVGMSALVADRSPSDASATASKAVPGPVTAKGPAAVSTPTSGASPAGATRPAATTVEPNVATAATTAGSGGSSSPGGAPAAPGTTAASAGPTSTTLPRTTGALPAPTTPATVTEAPATTVAAAAPSTTRPAPATTRPAPPTTVRPPATTAPPVAPAPTSPPTPPTSPTPPPTVPPTTVPTPPPTPAPTAPAPPPAPKPNVGALSVSTGASSVRVVATSGDRCANSHWVLSGPVSYEQSSNAPSGCFPNAHAFDSTWYQLTLSPGSYTISLTLSNAAGQATSSTSFTIS